jgi:hypothetical protein
VSEVAKQRELRQQVERFLAGGPPKPLLELLDRHPELQAACDHKYPFAHRIRDLSLGDRYFRLGRCILCGERLFLAPIDREIYMEEEGAPLWLTGKGLRDWAKHEDRQPMKDSVNWEDYRFPKSIRGRADRRGTDAAKG